RRGGVVELRVVPGSGTDEQRGGARPAPCRDLAADQRGDRQRVGESVRGADAHGRGHVQAAWAQRPGLPDLVLPSRSERPRDPLALAGDGTGDQSRLIPVMPPYEPLLHAYFALSPSLDWDHNWLQRSLEKAFEATRNLKAFLYVARSDDTGRPLADYE